MTRNMSVIKLRHRKYVCLRRPLVKGLKRDLNNVPGELHLDRGNLLKINQNQHLNPELM